METDVSKKFKLSEVRLDIAKLRNGVKKLINEFNKKHEGCAVLSIGDELSDDGSIQISAGINPDLILKE